MTDRVILPVTATSEMVAAFWRQKNSGTQEIGASGDERSDFDAYAAMLAASTNAGKVSEEEVEKAAKAAFNSQPWDCYSELEKQNNIHMIERALASIGLEVG